MNKILNRIFWSIGLLVSLAGSAMAGDEKTANPDALEVKAYGYIRLDMAYDSGRIFPGDYALYVKSESEHAHDNQLNVTANQSRVGLNLTGMAIANGKVTGQLEVDFYGGGPENKAQPLLRQAYLEMSWPESGMSFLLGQTWDLISPLLPDTINFLACAYAGDIGYRRPQIRWTKTLSLNAESKLTIKTALARTIGESTPYSQDTGTDAAFPTLEASLTYSVPAFTAKPASFGVSGHWGREEYDIDNQYHTVMIDTWSIGLDFLLPFTASLTVKANLWKGGNLDTFLGGIGQGVNPLTLTGIDSQGGWISLSLGPWSHCKWGAGASLDLPNWDQLPSGGRSQNSVVFTNVIYAFTSAFQLGVELSYWRTLYKNLDPGDSLRFQVALMYNF